MSLDWPLVIKVRAWAGIELSMIESRKKEGISSSVLNVLNLSSLAYKQHKKKLAKMQI